MNYFSVLQCADHNHSTRGQHLPQGSRSDFAEEVGRGKRKWSLDYNLFSCKMVSERVKGALNPDKVFTWVFGVHVNLRCRVSFSAQSVLGSGSKSVHLLSFVSSLLFLSFRILKAEIVECLNNINCVFYFNLSTKFLFKVSSYTMFISLGCGSEVAQTSSSTSVGTADPCLWTKFGPRLDRIRRSSALDKNS